MGSRRSIPLASVPRYGRIRHNTHELLLFPSFPLRYTSRSNVLIRSFMVSLYYRRSRRPRGFSDSVSYTRIEKRTDVKPERLHEIYQRRTCFAPRRPPALHLIPLKDNPRTPSPLDKFKLDWPRIKLNLWPDGSYKRSRTAREFQHLESRVDVLSDRSTRNSRLLSSWMVFASG